MKSCQKINLQEPQRNRNATANKFNLIMRMTVYVIKKISQQEVRISVIGVKTVKSAGSDQTPRLRRGGWCRSKRFAHVQRSLFA